MALRHLCLTAGPADELYTSYKTPNSVLIKHFASSGSSFIKLARASSRRISWWLPIEKERKFSICAATFAFLLKHQLCKLYEAFTTWIGTDKRIRFPLDPTCGSGILIDLLHRVEVNGVNTAKGGQTDLILPILMSRLLDKVIINTPNITIGYMSKYKHMPKM